MLREQLRSVAMTRRLVGAVTAFFAMTGVAHADVTAKAPDGFAIRIASVVKLDRDAAWARMLDIGAWWNPAHSYSGDAKSLNLEAKAGGCWCEIWSGGEVEHGRVVAVMPPGMLRINGALGPLQQMGVSATLTFQLENGAEAGTTKIILDYVVSGSSISGLDGLAAIVDGVLKEQVTRFSAAK